MVASPAQRKKVKGEVCIVCEQGPCDPAHVCARAQGGCDHPDCVMPLCRRCHNAYDTRKLNLEGALVGRFVDELCHALRHYGGSTTLLNHRLNPVAQ